MTIWQFHACMDGWRLVNGVKSRGREMSDERLAELGVEGF